jgi:hypothetical protein
VLRACITNYRTEPADVQALIQSLNQARDLERSAAAGREAQQKAVTF